MEELARYLLSRSHFSTENQRVKPHAFLPEPRSMETSVFRIRELTADQIWDLGRRLVAAPRGKELRARAEIIARAILDVGLVIHPNNVPERHAAIRGWPEEKERQIKSRLRRPATDGCCGDRGALMLT